jgi:hypothetical protein
MLWEESNSLDSLINQTKRLSKNPLNLSRKLRKSIFMKLKYLVVVILLAVIGLHAANNKRLFGVWEVVEFQLVQKGKPTVRDEKTLRAAGAVWDMYFNEDGSFKQEFNMRTPDMKMETEKGKWSTVNDSLFIELQIDTFTSKMKYSYILLGDAVVLTLQHPKSLDKVVTKFRRK